MPHSLRRHGAMHATSTMHACAPIHAPRGRPTSILANSHSLLQSGHALRVFSQRWIQSRWNTCPQQPQAIDRPGWSGSPVGLAWYSMLGSYRLFLQIAHVSVQMAQDHIATADHFLISNRFPAFPLAFELLASFSSGAGAFSTSMRSSSDILQRPSRAGP